MLKLSKFGAYTAQKLAQLGGKNSTNVLAVLVTFCVSDPKGCLPIWNVEFQLNVISEGFWWKIVEATKEGHIMSKGKMVMNIDSNDGDGDGVGDTTSKTSFIKLMSI